MARWPATATYTSSQVASADTLLITTPLASSGYASAAMLYMQVPYQLKTFSEHRWVSPPADLLLPLFADRVRELHKFKAVVTPPFSGVATYQLNTQLLMLQQEFMQPTSHVRLKVMATLLRVATGEVVASRVFEAVISAPGNNPYSGVVAANTAANQIANQLATFVSGNIK
ncbi:MAG: hypothetical protein A3E84_04690 [Gammaproteobacteria bacterium RIFCSPHIGHO2_12_FULL_42_13]|nr:MAG: hypothetical protein A3E84_04690 [Gammaproteobacteria bacterium RIFCSPHIGHO2_12_FULL_42_13]